MADWLGATIGAVGGLVNLGMGAAINSAAATTAYHRQRDLLKMQQDWLEYMSSTAHQREVKDLRSAGLNPILSATGGQGASVPSTSAPSVQAARIDTDLTGAMSDIMNSNSAAKQADTAKEQVDVNKKAVNSEVEKNKAQEKLFEAQAKKAEVEAADIAGSKPLPFGRFYHGDVDKTVSTFLDNSASNKSKVLNIPRGKTIVADEDFEKYKHLGIEAGKYRDEDGVVQQNGLYVPRERLKNFVERDQKKFRDFPLNKNYKRK